jgi:hypothetical protein
MLRTASSHAVHLLMDAVVGLVGLLGLAGCLLAWRLAQGPIDITALVRREAPRLVQGGAQLSIGSAALAWEGFHASDSPLDIRWRDVTITTGAGNTPISLPSGLITLAVSRLLLGQIVPRTVEIDDATIDVRRDFTGAFRLDLEKPAPADAPAPSGEGGVAPLLRELTRSPGQPGALPFLAQLERIHIRNATVTVQNPAAAVLWQAQSASVDLERQPDGGVTGQAGVVLDVHGAHSTLSLHANLTGAGTHVVATATPISPAVLAAHMPSLHTVLSPVSGIDTPVGFRIDATLDPHLALTRATAAINMGAGKLRVGTGEVAIQQATAVLEGTADHAVLQSLRVALQAPPAAHGPPPVITAHATATRANSQVHADFTLDIDRASFADLTSYWPAGTGGGARPWITGNIPAGTAENAHVTGGIDAAADFSSVKLTALGGGLTASGLTVYWLRPVPPIDHGQARLTIDSTDALHIDVLSAQQGQLKIPGGRVRITGLAQKDQIGDISLQATGALPEFITLLNNPRLKLLSRRPVTMQNPAGTVAASLSVKLPLDDRVTLDDIDINASAKMTGVHLGAVAAGRDLDDGKLDMKVDSNNLTVAGTATFGGIPVTLGVDMDFRLGPPTQVLQHVTAQGTATAAQLVTAGLWGGVITGGTTGVLVDYSSQRNGNGVVAMSADLAAAVIATPLGWNKSAGPGAAASAKLRLFHDSLTGIDQIKANGPGLLIASHAELIGGQPRLLHLDAVKIGRTSARGSITLPRTAKDKLTVVLRGQTLDLSSYFEKRDNSADTADTADDDTPGNPWSADIAFDQMILAKDEQLSPVAVRAESNGKHISRGDVTAGPGGQVRGSIVPVPGGRKLTVNASDSGAVLLAAGVANNIRGGTLRVDATYADTKPHEPLTGNASLAKFRLTNAPVIGRLLTAMTLYGAVNLLSGPGLGFNQATVPFTWQQRVLHMNNARAFSASLGITAQGDIDLRRHQANVTGTVVPAYFFNQLPGKIPLLGKLFSPEKGGGLFAASYSVKGKLANPSVSVNPLSALTPGFLRGIFGLF